ncbi:hypothetical protein P7L68_19660 [Tistrella mobilis]|uniref:hypothetical protein n=1 Tax=Tistrella mobilis TaxID=171437 RepID=UPI0035572F3C
MSTKLYPLSDHALEILRHTIGHDEHGPREGIRRNYFAACRGGDRDRSHLVALCLRGLLRRGRCIPKDMGDLVYYHVTKAGREYVEAHRIPRPPLTRSQQRYRAYLAADTGETFIEWLRRYPERRYWGERL